MVSSKNDFESIEDSDNSDSLQVNHNENEASPEIEDFDDRIHEKIDSIQKYIDQLVDNLNKKESISNNINASNKQSLPAGNADNSTDESLILASKSLDKLNESLAIIMNRVEKLEQRINEKSSNDQNVNIENTTNNSYESSASSDNDDFNINIDPDVNIDECLELLEKRIEGNGLLPEQRNEQNQPIITETKVKERPQSAKLPLVEHSNVKTSKSQRPKTANSYNGNDSLKNSTVVEFLPGPTLNSIKKSIF